MNKISKFNDKYVNRGNGIAFGNSANCANDLFFLNRCYKHEWDAIPENKKIF